MHDLYEILEPLQEVAHAAVDAALARSPQGFAPYELPIDEAALRAVTSAFDLSEDWPAVLEQARGLVVTRLRALQHEGRIGALDTQGNDARWRSAARAARHPLVRLLADAEFGAALTAELELALAEARTLPGWNKERPALVPHKL